MFQCELADIVYIFISPDLPGIMFYDRSPDVESPDAKFVGSLPEGKFLTDSNSILSAQWDATLNIPNGSALVRYKDGSVKVTTIMVTEEKMRDIVNKISNSKDPNRIVIDVGRVDNLKYLSDKYIDYDNQYNILGDFSEYNNDDMSLK